MMVIERDCVEECFNDVKFLIYDTVQKFRRMYGIRETEELVGIGNLAFMIAVRSYKKEQCSFSVWVRFVVWKRLLDFLAQEKKIRKHREDERHEMFKQSHFIDLVDDLGEDAKKIINLIFHTPSDLQQLIESNGGEIKDIRKMLRTYLKEQGWKDKQIQFAYKQIQMAL